MTTETFQISLEAAEAYEAQFVPALFAEWAEHVVGAAGVTDGQRVLDVACGTGAVTRVAAARAGAEGEVIGLDLNEAMLTVARRLHPDIGWRQGDVAGMPFPDDGFDVVLCQSAMMFFPDRAGALREMARVVRPGGTVTVQVWASLSEQPAYGPFVEIAARYAGPEAVELLGAYWVLGDLSLMASLFEAARLDVVDSVTRTGTALFPSIDAVVKTEIESTPLHERIDEGIYQKILADARVELARFGGDEGARIPIGGHVITARKPAAG